jgi:hypothetical protein
MENSKVNYPDSSLVKTRKTTDTHTKRHFEQAVYFYFS